MRVQVHYLYYCLFWRDRSAVQPYPYYLGGEPLLHESGPKLSLCSVHILSDHFISPFVLWRTSIVPAALTRVTTTRKSAPFFKDSTSGLRLLTVGETGVSGHLAVIANYLLIGLSPLFLLHNQIHIMFLFNFFLWIRFCGARIFLCGL